MLTGTVRIYDGTRWIDTEPGDFVCVPVGGIHGFRNESGEPASMLIHFAPGAPREGYFEGLAEFAVSGIPDDDQLAAFYLEHDNVWLEECGRDISEEAEDLLDAGICQEGVSSPSTSSSASSSIRRPSCQVPSGPRS